MATPNTTQLPLENPYIMNVSSSYGAMLIGSFISCAVWGVSSLQTWVLTASIYYAFNGIDLGFILDLYTTPSKYNYQCYGLVNQPFFSHSYDTDPIWTKTLVSALLFYVWAYLNCRPGCCPLVSIVHNWETMRVSTALYRSGFLTPLTRSSFSSRVIEPQIDNLKLN